MKQIEEIQIILSARHYLYKMFQTILGNEPTKEILDYLTTDLTKESVSLFLPQALGDKIELFIEKFQQESDRVLKSVLEEYTKEFIGPAVLTAPPWESVYLSKERLLFQESTLEVRRRYLKYNFIPAEYPHVADDHISIELDFMAKLAALIENAYSKKEVEKLLDVLAASKEFLQKHLLVWLPLYLQDLQKAKTQYLYYDLAFLLVEFINADNLALTEIEGTITSEQ